MPIPLLFERLWKAKPVGLVHGNPSHDQRDPARDADQRDDKWDDGFYRCAHLIGNVARERTSGTSVEEGSLDAVVRTVSYSVCPPNEPKAPEKVGGDAAGLKVRPRLEPSLHVKECRDEKTGEV